MGCFFGRSCALGLLFCADGGLKVNGFFFVPSDSPYHLRESCVSRRGDGADGAGRPSVNIKPEAILAGNPSIVANTVGRRLYIIWSTYAYQGELSLYSMHIPVVVYYSRYTVYICTVVVLQY